MLTFLFDLDEIVNRMKVVDRLNSYKIVLK